MAPDRYYGKTRTNNHQTIFHKNFRAKKTRNLLFLVNESKATNNSMNLWKLANAVSWTPILPILCEISLKKKIKRKQREESGKFFPPTTLSVVVGL